jgi:type II secretory pathway component PulF
MKKSAIVLLVFSITFWLAVDVVVIFVVPVFAAMFADFGARLPGATRECIRLSSIVRAYGFFTMPIFYAILAAVSVFVAKKQKRVYSLLFFASGALAVLGLAVILFLPIFY